MTTGQYLYASVANLQSFFFFFSDTSQSGASSTAGRSAMLKDAALAPGPSPEVIIPPQKYPPVSAHMLLITIM